MEHQWFLREGTLVRCLARRIARLTARVLARAVCNSDPYSADPQGQLESVDVADDGVCKANTLRQRGKAVVHQHHRRELARRCRTFKHSDTKVGLLDSPNASFAPSPTIAVNPCVLNRPINFSLSSGRTRAKTV